MEHHRTMTVSGSQESPAVVSPFQLTRTSKPLAASRMSLILVHRVPDAIGELSDFLQLRLGSNRSVGVRLDAADVNDCSGAGEKMLELDSEVGEDARNTAGTNPVG